MLQRDSGPSGWVDRPGRRYEPDGWGIFEGNLDSPHMGRGWFRCTADGFRASKGAKLSLRLTRTDGSARLLTVEIVRVKTTEPEWEFVAARELAPRERVGGTWDTTRPARHTTSPCPG